MAKRIHPDWQPHKRPRRRIGDCLIHTAEKQNQPQHGPATLDFPVYSNVAARARLVAHHVEIWMLNNERGRADRRSGQNVDGVIPGDRAARIRTSRAFENSVT